MNLSNDDAEIKLAVAKLLIDDLLYHSNGIRLNVQVRVRIGRLYGYLHGTCSDQTTREAEASVIKEMQK